MLSNLCYIYPKIIANISNLNSIKYRTEGKDTISCFGFMPYPDTHTLIKDLTEIYKSVHKETGRRPKFIDIGCGIGNIIMLAAGLGYDATGLEYDSKIFETAKHISKQQITHKYSYKIIKGDMRKFKHYSKYDVLYYYQPIFDCSEMRKFSTELAKKVKPGTYIIARGTEHGYKESKDFYRIGKKGIWRKKGKFRKLRNE